MDRIAAARGAIVCFRFDLVELRRCSTLCLLLLFALLLKLTSRVTINREMH